MAEFYVYLLDLSTAPLPPDYIGLQYYTAVLVNFVHVLLSDVIQKERQCCKLTFMFQMKFTKGWSSMFVSSVLSLNLTPLLYVWYVPVSVC